MVIFNRILLGFGQISQDQDHRLSRGLSVVLEYHFASLCAVATATLLHLAMLLIRVGNQGIFHVFDSELIILKKLFCIVLKCRTYEQVYEHAL
jgi:hypothetical protein